MGVEEIFQRGELILPPSISPGIVSFLYSLASALLWFISLTLGYLILSRHIALSPVSTVTLRQFVLLNEFGTYLNPHPAHPWWKFGLPYPFERKILYRGMAGAVFALLMLPRLMIAWSELMMDNRNGMPTWKTAPRAANQSLLFASTADSSPEQTDADPHWLTRKLVLLDDYILTDWPSYMRLASLQAVDETSGFMSYPSAACFHPTESKMSRVTAMCEGVSMTCSALSDEERTALRKQQNSDYVEFDRSLTAAWPTNLDKEDPELPIGRYSVFPVTVPGMFMLEPSRNQNYSVPTEPLTMPITVRGWGTARVEGSFYEPGNTDVLIPAFALVVPYQNGNFCAESPETREAAGRVDGGSGWSTHCTSKGGSMSLWMGRCTFSLWRGVRRIDIPDENRADARFVDSVTAQMKTTWRSGSAGELLEGLPQGADTKIGLLLASDSLGVGSVEWDDRTEATAERLFGHYLFSYLGYEGPYEHGGEKPEYEVRYEEEVPQVVVYLYPLAIGVGLMVLGLAYYLAMPWFFRRSHVLPAITPVITTTSSDDSSADPSSESKAETATQVEATPLMDEHRVREVYTDNLLTAHGLMRFLINHGHEHVHMNPDQKMDMKGLSIEALEKLLDDATVQLHIGDVGGQTNA